MYLAYTQDSAPPTNVRSGKGTNHSIIGGLQNNTVITVKEKLDNGWLQIVKPIEGYISGKLAKPDVPCFERDRVGSIADWQHLLNGCGYYPSSHPQLIINDQFDEATIAVTKKFQKDLDLEETGECTLATWQAAFDHAKLPDWRPVEPYIGSPIVEPPSDRLSEEEKYNYCRQVIMSHGGNFFDGVNRRNLLSFRQETSTKENRWKGLYDDVTFMLWKDGNGQKHCNNYKSNTEPSSWYEDNTTNRNRKPHRRPIYGRDANRDGRKDLGRLQEGYYEYKKGYSSSLGNVLIPTEDAMTVIRDIDHDGIFEDHEPMLGASDMLFHAGLTWRTGSAGCQTMHPNIYKGFWKDLTRNGNPGVIGYTIVRWKSL
ncbi:MAG: SH3 domain-containing protein [Microcystaceae cyanobacterium]